MHNYPYTLLASIYFTPPLASSPAANRSVLILNSYTHIRPPRKELLTLVLHCTEHNPVISPLLSIVSIYISEQQQRLVKNTVAVRPRLTIIRLRSSSPTRWKWRHKNAPAAARAIVREHMPVPSCAPRGISKWLFQASERWCGKNIECRCSFWYAVWYYYVLRGLGCLWASCRTGLVLLKG